MKTTFPVAKNELNQKFSVISLNYSVILDFARYTIRMDPKALRGWFKSEIRTGAFEGDFAIVSRNTLTTTAPELPPQIRLALERAGYVIDNVRCAS